MNTEVLTSALQVLSQLLYKHYGKSAIILIDEYDVPLDKAFQHGYYREMVFFDPRSIWSGTETNEFLKFEH